MITCDAFVTDTRGFRVQTNILSKQDDFSTFSTKALDIYKLPHSLIHMSTTKRMSCCKTSNIFYPTVPRIVKIFWETYRLYSPSLAFKLFDPHAGPSRLTWVKPNAQIFTQMRFFSFEFSLLEIKTGVWINSVGLNSNSIRLMWSTTSKLGHCSGRKPSLDIRNRFPTGRFLHPNLSTGCVFLLEYFRFISNNKMMCFVSHLFVSQ